ncbi:ABC transporter substrate-binding protein [Fuscibacter oryzae]|uniref:Extracellular solute-binding protein n=1 Tax=Fuscibacter oryzae TaxID=2803939 RepID=A0A8J7MVR4_9RHOB|nr:PotD/PotF family extracellular solute-binding protein [Fuscibacter oryzae]MBL4929438.1 extracellular solute-binding protein [Fuscibacter oryzae]
MKSHWTTDQIRDAAEGKLSRRRFINGAAALTGGAVLAPMLPGFARAAGGELSVMAWEGFTMETELKDWLASEGITIKASIIGTQDDVNARLVGSTPVPTDVSEFNQGYNHFYGDELAITTPLDESKLPNYNAEETFAGFYKAPTWFWDGKLHGVPWIWGLNSLVYNPAVVPEPKSYADLLKPEYKDKLAFGDDTLATWPMIARVAGYGDKFPNLTVEELDDAFAQMDPYRAQCRVFAASNGDSINLLVNGEIGALFCGWSGIPNETAKQGVETKYVIPAEGAAMWCDAWFIPTAATNTDLAHAYINATLGAQAQADVCKNVVGGTVQKPAVDKMDDATKGLFDYGNLDAVFASSPLQGIPPRESDEFATYDQWVAKWEEFKLGF